MTILGGKNIYSQQILQRTKIRNKNSTSLTSVLGSSINSHNCTNCAINVSNNNHQSLLLLEINTPSSHIRLSSIFNKTYYSTVQFYEFIKSR